MLWQETMKRSGIISLLIIFRILDTEVSFILIKLSYLFLFNRNRTEWKSAIYNVF